MKDIVLAELVDPAKLKAFCEKWKIVEFALFGSVLRDDFGPDSDIDVLVDFAPDGEWTLLNIVEMEDELRKLFGREVDLVLRKTMESHKNIERRNRILGSARTVYVPR
jgi:predicted nucleotidyltransferase